MKLERKLKKIAADFAILLAAHPGVFVVSGDPNPRALKVGIDKDLIAAHPEMRPYRLGRVLWWYVHRKRYYRALAAGGQRVDLDGNPAGELDAKAIEYGKEMLKRVTAARAKRKDAA